MTSNAEEAKGPNPANFLSDEAMQIRSVSQATDTPDVALDLSICLGVNFLLIYCDRFSCEKRHFGALQQKPLSNGSSVLSSYISHNKIYGSQFSSETFKAKVKELFNTKFNLDYLQSQQRNIVPAYMYWTNSYCPSLAFGQLVYSACILSFLGGVSWGSEMVNAKQVTMSSLSYSVLLPLIAWPAVLLYPYSLSFIVMIGGISYAGYKDILNSKYPEWFVNLRFILSTLVASALTTTLIFYWTKDGEAGNRKLNKQELEAVSQE
ncbi:Transmembrane protein 69 [Bulinus truncatus]|nr:Transmembrane protein 69 [Bulinus truncatus]